MTPAATHQADECKRLARAFAGAFHNNTGHEPSVSLEYRCWDEFSAAIDKLASMAPAGGLAEEAPPIREVGWHEPWRVGEFVSSAHRPEHCLMLAVGKTQIASYWAHPDFVRWVDYCAPSTPLQEGE